MHLEERTGSGWHTLSTRLDEAGHLVDGLLGLSLAQFCQVVLLPQGQFADFLRADAERRRTLLESLFDTGRFTTVERWLVARRQETGRALDEVDQRLAQVLARLAEAAGADLPADLDPADAAGWVAALLEQARTARADAQTVAAAAEDRHEASAATLESATLVAEAHTRRTRLQARLAVLTEAAGEHAAAAAVVEAARAVAPVVPLVAEVARLQVELETARAAVAAAGTELAEVLPATGTDGAAVGSAVEVRSGRSRVGRLPAPTELSSVARRRRDEVAQLRAHGRGRGGGRPAGRRHRRPPAPGRRARRPGGAARGAPRRCSREAGRAGGRPGPQPGGRRGPAGCRRGPRPRGRPQRGGRAPGPARGRSASPSPTSCARAPTPRRRPGTPGWTSGRPGSTGMAAELAAGWSTVPAARSAAAPSTPCPPRPARARSVSTTRPPRPRRWPRAEDLRAGRRRPARRARHPAGSCPGGGRRRRDLSTRSGRLRTAQLRSQPRWPSRRRRPSPTRPRWPGSARSSRAGCGERVSLDQNAATLKAQVLADRDRLRELRATLDDARGTDPSIAARVARLARLADGLDALVRQVETVDRLEEQVAAALERAEQAGS